MQRNRNCASRRTRGASAVEFALVMPLFFLLLFGIVDFGWYFFNQHTIQYATREGTRLALVGVTLPNPDYNPDVPGSNPMLSREDSIESKIREEASVALSPANLSNLQIDIYPVKSDYSDPVDWDTADPDAGTGGQYMRVRVRYNYQFLTPLIGNLFPPGVKEMSAEALYRNENF